MKRSQQLAAQQAAKLQEWNEIYSKNERAMTAEVASDLETRTAEIKLGDGQMVRTPAENVRKQPTPKTKGIASAPENKQIKPGENKGERK